MIHIGRGTEGEGEDDGVKVRVSVSVRGFRQWRIQGLANGQLPNEFGGLPIVIFISNFLPIEILLFRIVYLLFN